MLTPDRAKIASGEQTMVARESAGLTDVGKKRRGNEDAFLIDDALGLYVVSDGMGGRNAGEVASSLVINAVGRTLRNLKATDNLKAIMTPLPGLSEAANRLVYSVLVANKKTHEHALSHPECKGMGATLSAVHVAGGKLVVCNVGDSPIYLFRDGGVETLSNPHTVMAEQESIAPEGGLKIGKQYLHMITRAMGIGPTVQPDVKEVEHRPGDVLVICSDGLSDKTFPEEIAEVVLGKDSEAACQKLVAMANERGGDDNITVIVLKIAPSAAARIDVVPDLTTQSAPDVDAPVEADEDVATPTAAGSAPYLIVEYDTEDASYTTQTRSLRMDGLFLETTEAITEGEDLLLNITDPATDDTIMISGTVAGRNPKGVDIVFEDLTPVQLETIKSFVAKF